MQRRTLVRFAFAVGATFTAAISVHAAGAAPLPAADTTLLREIPDPVLATMRGRFLVGNNSVAYFGVTMASSWITPGGEQLSGGVVMGMHFGAGSPTPVVTFSPTMTIISGTPGTTPGPDTATRSVDGAGLHNINGVVQGIQVAGDNNHAVNVTTLRVGHAGDGTDTGAAGQTPGPYDSQVSADDANVAISFNPAQGVSLTLGIKDQGLVTQWIRNGSVGQLVQVTADGQVVRNQLQLDLVLGNATAPSQSLREASRALLQARMAGAGG